MINCQGANIPWEMRITKQNFSFREMGIGGFK